MRKVVVIRVRPGGDVKTLAAIVDLQGFRAACRSSSATGATELVCTRRSLFAIREETFGAKMGGSRFRPYVESVTFEPAQ